MTGYPARRCTAGCCARWCRTVRLRPGCRLSQPTHPLPLVCAQNEGLAYRFRNLLLARSVDFMQPNAVISGGCTQCMRIAALANAFNVPITNGGVYPLHNTHLQAGVGNGTKSNGVCL